MKLQELKYLPIIWLSIVVIIIILALLKIFIPYYDLVSFWAVFIHSAVVLMVLATVPQRVRSIFILAFLFRLLIMIWDLYAQNIFKLPNSGVDSEMYYQSAVRVSNNLILIKEHVRGGFYAKVMGMLFYVIGPQRMFAQYLNVLIGLFVVITIYKIQNLLRITPGIANTIIFIAAFFPNSLVMSAIFLREIIPTFFVTLSLYYFMLWYKNKEFINVLFSIIMLAFAAVFHSGIIALFVGYAFFFLFYNKENNKFIFSSQTLIAFTFLTGVVFLASTQFGDLLFGKFQVVEDVEDIYIQANRRLGNSAYLKGIKINNTAQFFMYSPIKTFYFLASPLPMNWRGSMDIFSFSFDSLLYLWVIFYFLKNRNRFNNSKPIITALVIMLISISVVFGVGVGNAGTAIRHRQKILPVFLVLSSIMIEDKRRDLSVQQYYRM